MAAVVSDFLHPVSANTLVVDSYLISGDASFNKINNGQDASTLTETPGATGNLGVYGLQADTVTITNLRHNNYATTAATLNPAQLPPELHVRRLLT